MVESIRLTVPSEPPPKAVVVQEQLSPAIVALDGATGAVKLTVADAPQPQAVVLRQSEPPAVVVVANQGPPGPAGAPGVGGVPTPFLYEQSSPNDTWVINHNFGRRPVVELYTVGGVAMEGNIVHINGNQAQVLFSSPIAGFATIF